MFNVDEVTPREFFARVSSTSQRMRIRVPTPQKRPPLNIDTTEEKGIDLNEISEVQADLTSPRKTSSSDLRGCLLEDLGDQDSHFNHDVNPIVKKFLDAIKGKDYDTLAQLTPDVLRQSYLTPCSCGFPESSSVWSYLEWGGLEVEVLEYLVKNDKIAIPDQLFLLNTWFAIASTEIEPHIVFLMEWVVTHHLEASQDFREKEYGSSLLYSSLCGYVKEETWMKWALQLLNYGFTPFDPHHGTEDSSNITSSILMLRSAHWPLIQRVEELYPGQLNVNEYAHEKPIDGSSNQYNHGRNNLLHLLHNHRYFCKSPMHIFHVQETVRFMLARGIDLKHEDRDGRNVTNYLYDYEWWPVLKDVFGVTLPIPKNRFLVHRDPIYKFMNPSPFAFFLYTHRFKKMSADVAEVEKQCEEMVAKLGLPDMWDTGRLRHEDGDEYKSLVQLTSNWGYDPTRISQILKEDEQRRLE